MANVQLSGVQKTYPNGAVAVRGVDMSVEDGEFIVFVGPSGCGKSTLLRMIAGLEKITEGDINMSYGLKKRGMPKAEVKRKVEETAGLLRIADFLDRQPNQLSGGQRQRVAMGRAIVREPKVFLFDEPLSNLDAKLRVQMRIEIKRLQRRLNVTSIYVTHDQTEAMTLADRLAVINEGKIEQIGAPIDLYNDPASLFVASFIGSPQVNLLPVTFDGSNLINGELSIGGFNNLPQSKPLVLGIRPDDLWHTDQGQFTLRVDIVEQHGADNLIYGAVQGADLSTDGEETEFCFKTSQDVLPELESTLKLGFDSTKALVFDQQTGERLI